MLEVMADDAAGKGEALGTGDVGVLPEYGELTN